MVEGTFRAPRIWSNGEIRRFGRLFSGKVLNASGWRDEDKEGGRYKDYFPLASEYWISNYVAEACGFQGDIDNEFFLDLSAPLKHEAVYDVVFNHTVLEHIFEVDVAFENLCRLSDDIVMIVVPFLQEEHADYGDFWRFSPQAMARMFEVNGFRLLYLSYNNSPLTSVYIFSVASRKPEKWPQIAEAAGNLVLESGTIRGRAGRGVFEFHRGLSLGLMARGLRRLKKRIFGTRG